MDVAVQEREAAWWETAGRVQGTKLLGQSNGKGG